MVQQTDQFGLQDQGMVPYGALDSLYPYLTYGPNLALALAQMQFSGANDAAQIQAQLAAQAMQTQGQLGAAQIGAQGQLDAQYIASVAQLQGLDASLKNDIIIAAGGDQNDINKLNAQLAMQGNLANQQMMWNLAKAGGSGDLRDNFARLLYLGGQGPQPGMFSAMQGLPSPWVTAPQAQYTPYAPAAGVNMSLPQASAMQAPSVQAPNINYQSPNASSLFSSILGGLPSWMQQPDQIFGFDPTAPAPALTPMPSYGMPGGGMPPGAAAPPAAGYSAPGGGTYTYTGDILPLDYVNNPANWGTLNDVIYGPGNGMPGLAGGGMLGPGQTALVAEAGPEWLKAGEQKLQVDPAVVQFKDGKVAVSPIKYGMQTGGVLTGNPYARWGGWEPGWAPPADAAALASLPDYEAPSVTSNTVPDYDAGLPRVRPAAAAPTVGGDRGVNININTPNGGTSGPSITPGGPGVTDLPFFKQLMSGIVPPSWTGAIPHPTAPELGITQPVKLPWEAAATYQKMLPPNQQNALMLWEVLGIPPAWSQMWINQATPGWRANPVQALGF